MPAAAFVPLEDTTKTPTICNCSSVLEERGPFQHSLDLEEANPLLGVSNCLV